MGRARGRLDAVALASILVAIAIGAAGCGRRGDGPRSLADGSPARSPAVEPEGVDGAVILVRTTRTDLPTNFELPRVASCLRAAWDERPAPPIVHTVGSAGESVTFASRSRRTLQACDGDGSRSRTWCGHAFGRLSGGHLRDPRLDLGGCRTDDGRPVAFLWIEPGPGTRYVVVRREGFSEAYETEGGLPVRVAVTERVDKARSRAVVEVSEHSAVGRRLRAREIEAVVSG